MVPGTSSISKMIDVESNRFSLSVLTTKCVCSEFCRRRLQHYRTRVKIGRWYPGVMKGKFLTAATCVATVIGGGVVYGFCVSQYSLMPKLSSNELDAVLLRPVSNLSHPSKICYEVACWPDRDFPHLIVQFKEPNDRRIIRKPSRKYVEHLLESSADSGIDFSFKIHSVKGVYDPIEIFEHDLVKNGKRTKDYYMSLTYGVSEDPIKRPEPHRIR